METTEQVAALTTTDVAALTATDVVTEEIQPQKEVEHLTEEDVVSFMADINNRLTELENKVLKIASKIHHFVN